MTDMTDRIHFCKMQGAGNDFIVVFCEPGSTEEKLRDSASKTEEIMRLCSRKLGIGADGLLFLTRQARETVFKMDFYNCDGSRAAMCGNGLRCAALFAARRCGGGKTPVFLTDSGELKTEVISAENPGVARITIKINEPFRDLGDTDGFRVCFGIAGVPHAVVPVDDTDRIDVEAAGRFLRNHAVFGPAGTNVDFVELAEKDGAHRIRTYERGVEGETLACGTGIVSAGTVLHQFFNAGKKVRFLSRSGDILQVDISQDGYILTEVYLTGPAQETFEGIAPVRIKKRKS